jgi:hypothetical protein
MGSKTTVDRASLSYFTVQPSSFLLYIIQTIILVKLLYFQSAAFFIVLESESVRNSMQANFITNNFGRAIELHRQLNPQFISQVHSMTPRRRHDH